MRRIKLGKKHYGNDTKVRKICEDNILNGKVRGKY